MIVKKGNILLFFLISFVLAAYFGGNILMVFLFLWITLLAIAAVYYYLLPSSLPCTLELPSSCRKGEKITGYLHVMQNGFLPIFYGQANISLRSLYYKQEEEIILDITLMGREEGIAAFDLELPYTGMVEITLEKAELYGIFGIGKKTILRSLKKNLSVMPDISEIDVDFPDLSGFDPESQEIKDINKGSDLGNYLGVRPYRIGDPLRNIHWKLTGKTEELMVKEAGIPYVKETRLYLETGLNKLAPPEIDRLVDDYFSLAVELIHRGYPLILCWRNEGQELEEYRVENMDQLEMILEPFFHIQFWKSDDKRDSNIHYMSYDGAISIAFYHGEGGRIDE